MIKFLLISLLSFGLIACGGDSNPDDKRPPDRPSGKISGTAFDGLIINGEITIYDFSNGQKGEILGTDTTDGSGLYEISITTENKPLFLEVCGGRYIEEASGLSIFLKDGQCLYGVANYVSGQPVKMALTYFSTMSTGYAECLIENDDVSTDIAVSSANGLANNLAGYDITTVQPVDVTSLENATPFLTEEVIAGIYAAGISQMMVDVSAANNQNPHENFNSIYFANLMYEDIRSDCLLNGIGNSNTPLAMGLVPVTGDYYRYLQSKGMLEFINSSRNATGLDADHFNQNTLRFNDVMDATTTVEITDITRGSQINNFIPSDGSVINETITISAQIDDKLGIKESKFLIDGAEIGSFSDSTNPSVEVDTAPYGSGEFEIAIEVTNDLLITTTSRHRVFFSNSAPNITNVIPSNSSIVTGEVDISAEVNSEIALNYVKFFLDGAELISFYGPDSGEFSYQLNTLTLIEREHQILIRTEDITGQISEETRVVTIDNSPPSVTNFVPVENELISGTYTIRADVSDVSGIKAAKFLINGELLNGAGDPSRPEQVFTSVSFPDGFYSISIVVTDNADKTTTVTRNVTISNTPLSLNVDSTSRRSIIYVNRLPEQMESLEVTTKIGKYDHISSFSDIRQISFSGIPYAGIWLKCEEHTFNDRNTFAEITVNAVDSLGVSSSTTWTPNSGNTCYGYTVEI